MSLTARRYIVTVQNIDGAVLIREHNKCHKSQTKKSGVNHVNNQINGIKWYILLYIY